jgi:hypothetical protein
MKLYAMTVVAFAAGAAFSSAAFADECSVATLKGHYTYWAQGTDAAGKATAEVGQEHFDGAGNLSMSSSSAGTAEFSQDKGTYTVNGDCSGTSTYESGASYNFFVAPSGDNFVFTSTNEGIVQAGEDTRVDAE